MLDQISLTQCQGCAAIRRADNLHVIDPVSLPERVAPGEVMPAGECPDCGAVAHVVEARLIGYLPRQVLQRLFEAAPGGTGNVCLSCQDGVEAHATVGTMDTEGRVVCLASLGLGMELRND